MVNFILYDFFKKNANNINTSSNPKIITLVFTGKFNFDIGATNKGLVSTIANIILNIFTFLLFILIINSTPIKF